MARPRLSQFAALTRGERSVVMAAVFALPVCRVALAHLGLRRTARLARRVPWPHGRISGGEAVDPSRTASLVDRVATRTRSDGCLPAAVVTCAMLERRGLDPRVAISIDAGGEGARPFAHAFVTLAGRPLAQPDLVLENYVVMEPAEVIATAVTRR